MLEAMLQHFRTYGMKDLQFIIVNSKLPRAQAMISELQKRVSFDVFQETDEEEVWSVMEGGKDDMYVYDRCGRLTYYIPFPLSIMSEEQPIVYTAVLATYFRSPCGASCDVNTTVALEEFTKDSQHYVTDNTTDVDIMSNETMTEVDDSFSVTITTLVDENYTNLEYSNDTSSNDIISVLEIGNSDISMLNDNMTLDINETTYVIGYEKLNETIPDDSVLNGTVPIDSSLNETNNESSPVESYSFFNTLYNLFFNYKTSSASSTETPSGEHQEPEADLYENSQNVSNLIHDQHMEMENITSDEAVTNDDKKVVKSDRCAEADSHVCNNWSKKRLLHAQRCCSAYNKEAKRDVGNGNACRNFGKKRCKKIQTVLKCCIKTMIVDNEEEQTATVTSDEVSEEMVDTKDVVCCKIVKEGRLCRVSETSLCDEDEFVFEGPRATM